MLVRVKLLQCPASSKPQKLQSVTPIMWKLFFQSCTNLNFICEEDQLAELHEKVENFSSIDICFNRRYLDPYFLTPFLKTMKRAGVKNKLKKFIAVTNFFSVPQLNYMEELDSTYSVLGITVSGRRN